MAKYIGSIDQGTTSTRFILFDSAGIIVASHQLEHKQIFPQPGWVEHSPHEIWDKTQLVIQKTLQKVNADYRDIASIGITNQRETIVCWNPVTGEAYYNAIVWQDTRTSDYIDTLVADGGIDQFRPKVGLPLATYFSASKMAWFLDNVDGLREKARENKVYMGTIDSWILWNLTGGKNGGVHVTDATNASRTMLMNLQTLEWDADMCSVFSIPPNVLPEIRASIAAKPYGFTQKDGPLSGEIPIAGILGDQQAALFGQACFKPGMSKNTYGTGCFLLVNTGEEIIQSKFGLLSTVAFKWGNRPAVYALEGSIAVAGSLVQWVRDNLSLLKTSAEIESLAKTVEDSGGVYFVPAFAGLFAPHWKPNARGVITGLTGYVTKAHIARAVLEATAFQTKEIFDAMEKDSNINIPFLKVDGGMTVNALLMQFQADILQAPVIRPKITETTALGAAYAAGISVGYWSSPEEVSKQWIEDKQWVPSMPDEIRLKKIHFWNKAVDRSQNWIDKE